MTVRPHLRRPEILDAQLAQCVRGSNGFTRGAVAALRWLTAGGPGPLTGALATTLDAQSIDHELAMAQVFMSGPASTGREYAQGVEHALHWAESTTSGPPVSAEDGPTQGRGRSRRRK